MESTNARLPMTTDETKDCKPYLAPGLNRLSPPEAKALLLSDTDDDDSDVPRMLGCIDQLHGEKGS